MTALKNGRVAPKTPSLTHPSLKAGPSGPGGWFWVVSLPFVFASGCGGAVQSGAEKPASDTAPAGGDVSSGGLSMQGDEIERIMGELDQAEDQVFALLERPAAEGAETPPPAAPEPQSSPDGEPQPLAEESAETPCQRVCQALGSMQRSAERLCGLAGPDDQRCEKARSRVARAGERVASSCPVCSETQP